MYPLVFVHPEGNPWTLRAAFVGFCVITVLFVAYLFDRQRTFTKIKVQLLSELERNVELQIQASADQLKSMPDQNHFWDRLTMEFRRALTMEKTLSLVLVKVKPGARASQNDQDAGLSDAAKSMSKRFAPPIPSTAWPTTLRHRASRNRHPQRQAHRISVARGTASRSLALWQLI